MEQVIDVLQTVKLLRIKRPGIVEDLVRSLSCNCSNADTFALLASCIATIVLASYTVCVSFIQDQYQFIFTVVVRFLQSFDTYDNFKI